MIRHDLIQSDILTYLKSFPVVLSLLSDTKEIREDQWQGINFVYPCIRINMLTAVPDNECKRADIRLTIQVFSEETSSAQADKIAGIIMSVLHAKSFSQPNYHFSLRCTELRAAKRIDEKTWQSEVSLAGSVSG